MRLADDLAVMYQQRAIVEPRPRLLARLQRNADENPRLGMKSRGPYELIQRVLDAINEPAAVQQVSRRVANEVQLAEDDQIGFVMGRLLEDLEGALSVAVKIAHCRVELGDGNSHSASSATDAAILVRLVFSLNRHCVMVHAPARTGFTRRRLGH